MEIQQAQALAQLKENQPDSVRSVLYDSGYGDLADQWLLATSEFETAAHKVVQPAAEAVEDDEPASTDVLRAYARMCLSWSRISQLREQALGCIERPTWR